MKHILYALAVLFSIHSTVYAGDNFNVLDNTRVSISGGTITGTPISGSTGSFTTATAARVNITGDGYLDLSGGSNTYSVFKNGTTSIDYKVPANKNHQFQIGSSYMFYVLPTGISVNGTVSANGGSTNKAVCWKSGGVLGYCSSVVDAAGGCTCN